MRTAVVVLTLALIVSLAAANPVVYYPSVGVTFDAAGSYVPRADPGPYTMGEVFVVVMCPSTPDHNLVTISFALGVDVGVSIPVSWTSLLPGGLTIGDWTTGITLSSTEPLNDSMVYVCVGSLFYLGSPGEIRVLDHPDYPRWVTNVDGEVLYYCVRNGGVLMDPVYTGEECDYCENYNPVETSSWGAIKAMYR